MDWSALAPLVAPYAPTVGRMLGGMAPFPGGAALGEWAGQKLAEQFNVPSPTPEAVSAAIQASEPAEVAVRLGTVEGDAQAKWQAMAAIAASDAADRTAQSQAINETIRAEAGVVSWWHWRHLMGYAVLFQVFALTIPIFKDLWIGNVDNLAAMQQLIAAITPIYLGLLALLGYIASDTTALKQTAITGTSKEGIVSALLKPGVRR